MPVTYSTNPLLTQQRRTQRTQAGMPGQGGRTPFAPRPTPFAAPTAPSQPPVARPQATVAAPMPAPTAPAPTPTNAYSWPAYHLQQTPYPSRDRYMLEAEQMFGTTYAGGSDLARRQITAWTNLREINDTLAALQSGEFDELRRVFQQNLALNLGPREEQARRSLEQDMGRRGLSYSGLEQSAMAQLQAAVGVETARSLGEFESKLLQVQQAERARMRSGYTDFIIDLNRMSADAAFQRDLLAFQNELQKDRDKANMWRDILGSVGSLGMLFGGDVWGWAQNQWQGAQVGRAWSEVPDLGWVP